MSQNTVLSPSEEEQFQSFETKIDEVMNILQMMNSKDPVEQKTGTDKADRFLGADQRYRDMLTMDDFVVKVKENRTIINKVDEDHLTESSSMGKSAFMAEMERDAGRRRKERKERETIAQNLRRLGNQAFRDKEYEKAVVMYTKALDHIKDSFVIFNNRALAYLALKSYKRAIIDCDFVLQKLDEKNLRSWLCRANGFFMLGEMRDFEKSINEAKKNNPKEIEYIEKVIERIRSEAPLEMDVQSQ
ncbi:tetratricopeptide repeat protein 12 isoform X1 [Bradysia coprophila]|uniref:tetratricopeptide repeat protein 12 isoform X1 n=1 Tax=Bradysia coprophila TaxID=38358 RepID=UPI00187D7853|nr:tetratricopeptide repeat protein 12 isoform X1 [Bradysia coprophila]